jgi:putative ABC transport system substrate-binding protein
MRGYGRVIITVMVLLTAQIALPSEEGKPKIAIIKSRDITPFNQAIQGFKAHISGEVHEYDMHGELKSNRYIKEIIRACGFDLILAVGTLGAITAAQIGEVPTVYCMVINPERYKLGQRDHMTGVSARLPAQLTLSKFGEALPHLRRIGVIYTPRKTGYLVDEAKEAGDRLNLTIVALSIRTREEIAPRLCELWDKVDALWLLPDPILLWEDTFRYMITESTSRRVPILTYSRSMVESGVLLAVFPDYRGMGRQAAWLAKKILEGYPPSKLEPVQPISCRMAVNLKIAKLLGINLPKNILESAEIFPKP